MALLNLNKKDGDLFTAAELNKIGAAVDANTTNIEQLMAGESMMYGVEFDTAVSNPACTRIGNLAYHRSLPIHSRMRGCLLNDNGEVVEYLNPNNWNTNVLDGSRGQVMVELPEHYRKFETEGTKRRVKLSEYPLPGYHKVPKAYISAYEASIQRSTGKLSSVKNMTADYRGGNNNASYDAAPNTLLGRPVTSQTRIALRTAARKRKPGSFEWNINLYYLQKEIYWLFVVEYATLNTQAPFNAAKDINGYMQGGLGPGVTTCIYQDLNKFNGYTCFVPCGISNVFGNLSGEYSYSVTSADKTVTLTVKVPRYRGIENPFGHLMKYTDGCNINATPQYMEVYVCDDPKFFNDTGFVGYKRVGNMANGWIKKVAFGEDGDIVSIEAGGAATTYHCDSVSYSAVTTTQLRSPLFGGYADFANASGIIYLNGDYIPANSPMFVGTRLSFIPAN